MGSEWQRRLRELGVVKGVRNLRPAAAVTPPPTSHQPVWGDWDEPQPVEKLLPGGTVVTTPVGSCFVLDQVYPLTHWHGVDRLGDLLELTPNAAATFNRDPRWQTLQFRDCLFLDTETTGLWGAGTLAFMVGAAFFEDNAFVVRQYFLRDHGDETAMLTLLNELIASRAALITFNGHSFDLPLLDNRYLINRLETEMMRTPHLDLLPPTRRLWRGRLGSCALNSVEKQLLGVRRTEEDVPGYLIPTLYLDYLRQGDARELVRVFYHNQVDMLSMVTLLTRVVRQWTRPRATDHPQDLYSLGVWQNHLGYLAEAEATLRLAAAQECSLELYHQILHQLAAMLKQQQRREEAANLWMQIAATSFEDITAHIELAKHFEWHEQDIAPARHWTQQAITLAQSQSPLPTTLLAELHHRLTRLQHKLNRA
ncbi:MAG: ribonuclease H-like domain-containing protein [Anaerolineae bacterium]|nr:ribonuclease H-like domain-containing protein [Anaerolineae bacterium]